MSAPEFISSVAWPVTVLVVALLFRKSITEMLSGNLTRMKAGPLVMEWQRTVSEVEAEIGLTVPENGESPAVAESLVAELSSLARRSVADSAAIATVRTSRYGSLETVRAKP